MPNFPIMEEHLLFVWSNVANVENFCDINFAGPNSDIRFDSCNSIGTQICILVGLCFPYIIK